jgi:hypothetical protein
VASLISKGSTDLFTLRRNSPAAADCANLTASDLRQDPVQRAPNAVLENEAPAADGSLFVRLTTSPSP